MDLSIYLPISNLFVFSLLTVIVLFLTMSFGKLLMRYSSEYQPITSLFEAENSVGFNAIYRILIAPILIILFSILFYSLNLDSLVKNIWVISVLFFVFQSVLIISLGRWRLVNKTKFFLFHTISIALSIYLYNALISKGIEHLLPDETNLRTDLWLIVAAFLYGIFRSIQENNNKFEERKSKYIVSKAVYFKKYYGKALSKYSEEFQNILISIMIYEDFNRPRIVRGLEWLKKSNTRGILQVTGVPDNKIALAKTAKQIKPIYESVRSATFQYSYEHDQAFRQVFAIHNPADTEYSQRVYEIFKVINC